MALEVDQDVDVVGADALGDPAMAHAVDVHEMLARGAHAAGDGVGVVAQFFNVAAQVCTWTYLIQYSQQALHGSLQLGGFLLQISLIVFLISRFIMTWVIGRVRATKVLTVLGTLAVVLCIFAMFSPNVAGVAAVVALSFCLSLMFPTIYGVALQGLGPATKFGAAGMHIEDQVQSKRCGHRPGKEIVSKEEMVDRIKAAVDARTDENFVIMARTDALAVEGLDKALDRAVACVEAGADMIFPEAITELAMYRRVKDAVKVPILANITEFGQTPLYTRDELATVGVDIVLHCCSAYRAMNAAALNTYQAIRRDGTQKNVLATMQTRADLYKYLDYYAYEAKLDELFAEGKEK